MAKIINISDKLSFGKPCIQVGDKTYTVNDSLETVMKFEEVFGDGDTASMVECLKVALGEETCEELNFEKMSFKNIQVWFLAINAAMQDMTYEETESRFHKFSENKG
jgi:uncharacterized protein (DUF697 family)